MMDINQIKIEKEMVENEILKLLVEFESSTGAGVRSVDVKSVYILGVGDTVAGVNIEVGVGRWMK